MSRSFNGSSDYARYGGAVVSAYPFTMACWALPDNTTANHTLIWVGNSAVSNQYFELSIRGADGGDPVAAIARNTVYTSATTSTGFSSSAWNHCCGVWTNSFSRDAYLNGGGKGSNTESVSATGLGANRTTVGRSDDSTPGDNIAGLIAHPCIWNVALTEAEIKSLARGAHPLTVRPASIVSYWPLYGNGSPEPDEVGRFELPLTGTSKSSNNPPVISPRRKRFIYIPAAAPAGNRRRRVLLCGRAS